MISATTGTATGQPTTRSIHWHLLWAVPLALAVVFIATAAVWVSHELREFDKAEVRRSQDDLNSQLDRLRAGDTNEIYLYDTRHTDELLMQLNGTAEVEILQLELTDISDDGMWHVVTLPKLRKLVLYGGNPGISDHGLEALKGNQSIETLELINTHITDDGLAVLKEIQSLRSLTVFYESWREPRLSDAGLTHFKTLLNLEMLKLGGGWASAAAIEELQSELRDCRIVTGSQR